MWLVLVAFLLWHKGGSADATGVSTSADGFSYKVLASRRGTKWVLAIRVENLSGRPVRVFRGSLPWQARRAAILVAVTSNAKREFLEEALVVDDSLPDTVEIPAGASLEGDIFLERRFPSLATALRKGSVIVFWSFEIRTAGETPLQRQAGGVVLRPVPD